MYSNVKRWSTNQIRAWPDGRYVNEGESVQDGGKNRQGWGEITGKDGGRERARMRGRQSKDGKKKGQ